MFNTIIIYLRLLGARYIFTFIVYTTVVALFERIFLINFISVGPYKFLIRILIWSDRAYVKFSQQFDRKAQNLANDKAC